MLNHATLKPFNAPHESIRDAVEDNTLNIYAQASQKAVEILITEEIGEDWMGGGVKANDVRKLLKDNPGKPVDLIINSPGGLVYDGLQIYNALISHDAEITATIEGLAYSAASFVAMAADKIRMFEASDIGVHRAWGVAIGNKAVMADVGEWLAKTDNHLIDIYQSRTGQPRATVEGWLDGAVDGTLFSAKEAVEVGLADEVIPLKAKYGDSQEKQAAKKQFARRAAAKNKLLKAKLK